MLCQRRLTGAAFPRKVLGMSSSPLSIATPATGVFMSEEVAAFTPTAQQNGLSFIYGSTNTEIYEYRVRTRSAWVELSLEDSPAAREWAIGNHQCATPFDPRQGRVSNAQVSRESGIVMSSAGKMFYATPGAQSFKIEDISSGIVGSQSVRLAWMTQAASYCIRTDESSNTQIWDSIAGQTFTSTGYNRDTPAASRLPNFAGPLIATDRVWITNNRNEVIAGDHNHRIEPYTNVDLLKTTDQTYDLTSTSFLAPLEFGDITSFFVMTSYRGGGIPQQGELIIGTEGGGTWSVLMGMPRIQWSSTSMRRVIHHTLSATGPFAGWSGNQEFIFRSSEGVSTIKTLSQEANQVGNPSANIANEIKPLLDKDPLDLLIFASVHVARRRQRLVCTTYPVVDGPHWFHRGYVSMALAPGRSRTPEAGVWEGVQTLPSAMGDIIQFVEMRDLARLRVFAVTRKPDGTKGLAEWTNRYEDDTLADGTCVKIPWQLVTRKLTVGGEYSLTSFGDVFLSVLDIRDSVEIEIFARTRTDVPFKSVCTRTFTNPKWNRGEGGYADVQSAPIGPILDSFAKSPWVQLLVKGKGCCKFDLSIQSGSSGTQNGKSGPKTVCAEPAVLCQWDPFLRA